MPLIVICAIAATPVVLAVILRVNAIFVFLGIASGFLLQYALSDDVDLALATIIRGSDSIVVARLALLALPVLLTIVVLRKTAGKSMLFQFIPLVFSGLLLATLSLPLLPANLEQDIYNGQFGSGIKQSQDLVIAAAVVSNLVLAWTLYKHPKDHRKHHR